MSGAGILNLIRVLGLVGVVAANTTGGTVSAESCWDCEWCSNGEACCPTGSEWSYCEGHGDHCHVDPC